MPSRTKIRGLRTAWLVPGLLMVGLIAGCGSNEDVPGGGAAIDACALLKQADPAALLGESVGEGRESVHRQDAEATVSMCTYSVRGPGYKAVSLQVMYAPGYTNPKTASAYLEGQDFASAGLKKPVALPGLGDVALLLQDEGIFQLQVFWKQHYRMTVGFTEPGDRDDTLEKARSIARQVMAAL